MDAGALRISNCNYTADALLGFLRSLLARDEQLLCEVVLRSALMRPSADQELLWKALPTIEACAEFSPFLVSRSVLWEMAQNPDFSVRSSAASICMDLAQFAPDRVPVDLLTRLSVYSEDWYVESPANAALKAMAWHMPAV